MTEIPGLPLTKTSDDSNNQLNGALALDESDIWPYYTTSIA